MGKTIKTIIDRFDGGIATDLRTKRQNQYAIAKHFDVHTYPHKLLPYHKTEAHETKTMYIIGFLYGRSTTAATYRLFGYGKTAGGKAAVYKFDAVGGAGGAWADDTANESSLDRESSYDGDAGVIPVFFKYKTKIHMWSTNKLIAFDAEAEGAIDDDYISTAGGDAITYTTVAQPVHCLIDDRAYFFTDNKVYKLNDTSWENVVLTLPDNLRIVSACEYGNYLAIACVNGGVGDITSLGDVESVVYLWDRDSSLATISERISFGRGAIKFLANLDNKLIAVMDYYTDNTLLSVGLHKGKIIVKQALNGSAVILNQIPCTSSASIADQVPFIKDDVIYFSVSTIPINYDTHRGIMSVDGFGKVGMPLIVEEGPTVYNGIYQLGNQWWVSHGTDGSVDRTDDGRVYSTTSASTYYSLINGGDSRLTNFRTKKLIGVMVSNQFLPTNGVVNLYYRKDKDIDGGSWTQIFTNTTDDSMYKDAVIDASGNSLPEFREIQFKIDSLGGATITGLQFKSEFIDKETY